jgi:hypothetical protein
MSSKNYKLNAKQCNSSKYLLFDPKLKFVLFHLGPKQGIHLLLLLKRICTIIYTLFCAHICKNTLHTACHHGRRKVKNENTISDFFQGESFKFCGNGGIENDEECDGGMAGRQGLDVCCDPFCKLRPSAEVQVYADLINLEIEIFYKFCQLKSDINHKCCRNCQIEPNGQLCSSIPDYIDCNDKTSYCEYPFFKNHIKIYHLFLR